MKKLCVIRVVVGSSPAAAALTLKKKLTVGYCSSQQHLNSSSLVQLLWSSQVPQPLFLNSFRNFQTLSSRNSSISNDTKFKEQQHDDTSSTATATSTSSSPTTEQTSSSTPPTKNVISEEEEPITSNHRNNQRNTPPLKRKIISSSSSSSFHKLSKTLFWIALTTVGTVIIFLFYETNSERLDYYVSPTKIMENREDFPPDRKIRVGGVVKENSVRHLSDVNFLTCFTITDLKYDIEIEYKGILPDLFEENSTVICEGFMMGHNKLKCTNVLAKHDQRNGMPPEIAYEVEKNRREIERRKLYEEQQQMMSGEAVSSK